jgi:stage III sporulation protein AD
MDMLIKAAALAVTGGVIGLVIKKNSPEMALLLTIAVAVAAMFMVASALKSVVEFVKSLADTAGLSPAVLTIVLKTVGIAILTKLSADVCRDAGQQSVATGIELAGAVAALCIALPLMRTLLDMIQSLI